MHAGATSGGNPHTTSATPSMPPKRGKRGRYKAEIVEVEISRSVEGGPGVRIPAARAASARLLVGIPEFQVQCWQKSTAVRYGPPAVQYYWKVFEEPGSIAKSVWHASELERWLTSLNLLPAPSAPAPHVAASSLKLASAQELRACLMDSVRGEVVSVSKGSLFEISNHRRPCTNCGAGVCEPSHRLFAQHSYS